MRRRKFLQGIAASAGWPLTPRAHRAGAALAQSAVAGTGQSDKKRQLRDRGLRPLAVASLLMIFGYTIPQAEGYTIPQAQEGQPVRTNAGKPAYNIILVISDQRTYRLFT